MESKESPSPIETTAQLARKIFAELYEIILNQEAGVRLGEIEAIHAMRVATRRLRVALSNFAVCWTKEERSQIKSWLQELADALGEVRDLDVLLDTLSLKQAQLAPGEQQLLALLLKRLQKQRQRRFTSVLAYLESASYISFKHEFPVYFAEPRKIAAAAA